MKRLIPGKLQKLFYCFYTLTHFFSSNFVISLNTKMFIISPSVTDFGVYTVYLEQLMFSFCQNTKVLHDGLPCLHLQVHCEGFVLACIGRFHTSYSCISSFLPVNIVLVVMISNAKCITTCVFDILLLLDFLSRLTMTVSFLFNKILS